MVLLGTVPVLTPAPPTISRCSTTATWRPHFAPWIAARWPAGPEPITIRSNFCMQVGRGRRTAVAKPPAGLKLFAAVEPRLDFLPVNDVPPSGQIVRPA